MDVHGGFLDRTSQIFAWRRAEKLAGKRTNSKKRENLKDFPRVTPGSREEHYTVAPDSGKSFLGLCTYDLGAIS